MYEVTQGEWQAVTGDAPSHFSRKGGGTEAVKDISDADLKRFPVENISLPEARLFAEALTLREKEARWVYRLPTEAEWEYACRGGPGSDKTDYGYDFYFEKPTNELKPEQANFAPEPGKGLQRPCKVGSYIPNTLGLYDMHGNVWEWCDDEEKGGDGALLQVSRGGHWGDDSRSGYCRAAGRVVAPPSYCDSRRGLRLARVPVPPKNNNPPAQAPQQSGRPGEVFTNSLGMQFAWISPGSFLMGSPAEEQGRGDNEVQHRVTLTKGFYMGVYEVTRGQYAQFVKATGYRTQAEREGGANWMTPRFEQSDDHPVVWISWNDAVAFADWLSAQDRDGRIYLLPTEAEWEYACRAGSTTAYCSGNDLEALRKVAWFWSNGGQRTKRVGLFQANSWGLYDMHGNAGEWCQDWLGEYPRGDQVDPRGPAQGSLRVSPERRLGLAAAGLPVGVSRRGEPGGPARGRGLPSGLGSVWRPQGNLQDQIKTPAPS